MRARYIKELYYGPTIEFTPSGHVDMDVFDESDNREKEVLADFYDEEIEKLCKPIIESHISKLQKDDDTVNELLIEKTDYKKIGIGFFWKEIVHHESGFYTDDIGWDEETTDIFNKKYDWENNGFLKQIPKKKDFQKAFSIFVKDDFDCFINNRYDGVSFTEYLDDFFEVILKASILYHELYYETYGYLDWLKGEKARGWD